MLRPGRRPGRRAGVLAGLALAAALIGVPAPARADDRAAAAEAYDRGARAFDGGDFRQAAEHFQAADRLAPSAAALEGALTAATRADDAALALDLADRADTRRGDPRLDAAARDARSRFQGRAGKLLARCVAAAPDGGASAPTPCALRVANAPWAPGVARWIAAGDHVVVVDRGDGEERFAVAVPAGETVTWSPPAEAPAPQALPTPPPLAGAPPEAALVPMAPPPAPSSGGPDPAWFFVGLGITAVLGGAAIGTGVATLDRHDAFERSPSEGARDEGLLLQHTTNGLLAGAAVAGVVTVVLAAVVDWSGDPAPSSGRRPAVALRF